MKKLLPFFNNESGFFLPYVLSIVLIIILGVSTHIKTYQNEIYLTDLHLEHLEIETLNQMGFQKFKEDYPEEELVYFEGFSTSYEFPNGTVNIQYEALEDRYGLNINAITLKKSKHAIYKEMKTDVLSDDKEADEIPNTEKTDDNKGLLIN